MADELSNVNGGSTTNDSIYTGLPPGYTPPVSGFAPHVRFGSTSEVNNAQNPQQHSEYFRDYNVGSTSNAANSMAMYRQHVEESHHDLVNLLTQQMTTILNPMMADHESKLESHNYDKGERHNARGNNEGFENGFQNENNIFNGENPHIIPHGQNAYEVLARLRVNRGFYMRRKLLNVHIPDLAHLAEKVRQVDLMKKEKDKQRNEQKSKSKPFTRKEKVAYVTMESSEEELDFETEVDWAELKKGPPYSQVQSVYPRAGDGLLDFLIQKKIKDRDISLCPRCNAVFDAEAAAIFEKERIKKELAHRE
ncbi:hypothetical protein Ahy_A09g042249 [Arachis hypogaea]|uniref:Uncharacterized protein n=1 Tax=Arachis hypogaea TaxID=3818 RepID=A0A445BF92_ARAHY|nr:hypothetical protein Ahy_A09g042249 [Arachis hypogaea]